MREFLLFILFPAVIVADSIVVPTAFNFNGGLLAILLILTWTVFKGAGKNSLFGFIVFFVLEIFWGLNWGVLVLPFALILLLIFIAANFLNVGYAGFMQNNLLVRIFSLTAINISLFYVFYAASLWTEKFFYGNIDLSVFWPLWFNGGELFKISVLTAIYLSVFELINQKRRFQNV